MTTTNKKECKCGTEESSVASNIDVDKVLADVDTLNNKGIDPAVVQAYLYAQLGLTNNGIAAVAELIKEQDLRI